MKVRLAHAALGLALLGQPILAKAEPVIVGDQANPRCLTALAMAKEAFQSPHASLVWPVVQPDPSAATIVLSRNARDISGGNGLDADPSVFDRLELSAESQRVFWQREPDHDHRLLVVNLPFGWRGDQYYLYSANIGAGQEEIFDQIIMSREADLEATQLVRLLGEGRWNPPIILRDRATHQLWVIDQGDPYLGMGAWHIFETRLEGAKSPCWIEFTPGGEPGLSRLPPAVQRFARLVDEALGPGLNEGTLQPTGRIRGRVARDWALVSNRPWALTAPVYNSRAEVDAGLAAWSRVVPARARLYRSLQESYEPAERALAEYYVTQFEIPEDVARRFSTYAMDHMLRAHFSFHSATAFWEMPDDDAVPTTPWPVEVR